MADVSIEPIMAAITFLRPRFNNTKSCMPIASPIPIMGPISGEISIAPIITGILLVLSPSDAMNIANINTISCEPLNETPLLMLCSASNCGSRSSATLKYDLTFRLWQYKATSMNKEIQYQSINQGFRMVGSTNAKYGNTLRAFQIGDKVTLEYLNGYAEITNRVDIARPFRPSRMTRAEAREAYPEWYQRVVVERQRQKKKWDIKGKQGYALYEWWLRQASKVKGGHRYYFMMCLVIYACKCDVPKEKLERDLYDVYEELRFVEHENPLTMEDVWSALETYDRAYYNFTIADIEKLTDIRIERNKRNGRKQIQHMEVMRAVQRVVNPEWRQGNGRPSAEREIWKYMEEHPKARKIDVIRGTGFSKPTVYKYYDKIRQDLFEMLAQTDGQKGI